MPTYEANAPGLMERLRSALGVTERPNNMYASCVVQPVVNVGDLAVRQRFLVSNAITGAGTQTFLVSVMQSAGSIFLDANKRYRLLNLTAEITTLNAGNVTLHSVGYGGFGQIGHFVVGETNGALTAGVVGYMVGGDVVNPPVLGSTDFIVVSVPVNSAGGTVQINAVVEAMDGAIGT